MAKAPAIGIDLGTTYSRVGIFQHGKFEIITNDQGNRATPSYVAFTENERLIGDAAKNQVATNPTNTVFCAKRLIGRRYHDTQGYISAFSPLKVINQDDKPKFLVDYKTGTKTFYPEEISSMVLMKMKEAAEAYIGKTIKNAVISVPACFTDAQRRATKDAGTIAGFNVLRIINDPTAAAIAYGLDYNAGRNVLIYDLGGGTLDVSILTHNEGIFQVKYKSGYIDLGGRNFDARMMFHFSQEFRNVHKKDILNDKKALMKLMNACENAKIELSFNNNARIDIDSLFEGIPFHTSITRNEFENMCLDLFKQTLVSVEKSLRDAEMAKSAIHDIVLVGGSTRIPKVQKLLQEFFNGRELNTSIDADEAVVYGAAVQAAVLNGDAPEAVQLLLKLVDDATFSLGVKTEHSWMIEIVRRNTIIPTTQTKTIMFPDTPVIYVEVKENDRADISNNKTLGWFELAGIPRFPRGVAQFEITFHVDHDGIMHMSAVDKSTRNANEITIIDHDGRFSQQDIEQMVRDAEEFKKEDKINALKGLCRHASNIRKTVEDENLKDEISELDKKLVLQECSQLFEWMRVNFKLATKEECKHRQKEFENVCMPIVTKLYQGAGGAEAGGFPGGAGFSGAGKGPTIADVG